jgi:hypothetical protein
VGSFAARPPWDRSARCRPVGRIYDMDLYIYI